jgi:hypothetical protein
MTHAPPEGSGVAGAPREDRQIAALREEIRQSGKSTLALRLAVGVSFVFPALCFAGLGAASLAFCSMDATPVSEGVVPMLYGLAAAGSLWIMLALPAAFCYRAARLRHFRRRLNALSPEARVEVVLPLRTERLGDTRKIVAPLLRDFGIPTELTPAAAPGARGDEASPAETPT